ncbi:MAG: potassium channel family protein, partial [Nanoarchaeota archaeon]|nr:potassium channel family protein [Nanoarchaeota archaeon]
LENNLMGFFNSLYFSFISATATGYGDIVGTGFSKLLVILEVITGLLIFGILISKLVSYKQEIILEEIYDISFDEKINRLRSALYLFRADVVKFIEKTENKLLTEKKLQDFWIMLVSAENTIVDIKKFICPRKRKDFIKHIDDLKFELLLNSLDLTLSKILDLLLILNEKGDTWQNKSIVKTLNGIIKPCREIEEKYMHKTLNDKIKIRVQGIKKYLYEIENLIKDF